MKTTPVMDITMTTFLFLFTYILINIDRILTTKYNILLQT